jgi:hypothetical protein
MNPTTIFDYKIAFITAEFSQELLLLVLFCTDIPKLST